MGIMRSHPLRRCATRLLDGNRVWGSVDVHPGRFGIIHYRLVVFPPGLSRTDRRWIRVARGWPLWGVLLWLQCEAWLSPTLLSPGTALAVSAAVPLTGGAIVVSLAGEARRQVRTMVAVTMAGYDEPVSLAARDTLSALAARLIDADERLARHEISVVDHELIWWQVYDRVEHDAATSTRHEQPH
jgi:hypothetical protein